MKPINERTIILIAISAIIIFFGGIYWWYASETSVPTTEDTTEDTTEVTKETSTEKEMQQIISEMQVMNYAVAIEQIPSRESVATVRDTYNEGAGFSLRFPSSWGLVNVTKRNLTDSGGGKTPQRASYTFTSEFKPHTHYFTVIISFASEKDNPLVTQGHRIYITEDENYYYNYNPSTKYCVEEGKCKVDKVNEINEEIQGIIDSFELL